jgi:hypothetical protein
MGFEVKNPKGVEGFKYKRNEMCIILMWEKRVYVKLT